MTSAAKTIERIQTHDRERHGPPLQEIRDQLDRIIQSKTFRRAKRLRGLLEYVVTAATKGQVNGQAQTACDLFGKSADFDPSVDPVIRVQFGRLRRALTKYYSAEGEKDSVIITIPNGRYSPVFQEVSSVEVNGHWREEEAGEQHGPQALPSTESDSDGIEGSRRLIAVLPFTNLTSDPAQDVFCYGLTEEIANGLASIATIDVVASGSTLQFKDEPVDVREVGRELGVPFVLEGSVRMEEGHTRVIAQLARSTDGVAVWSDSFDDEMNGSLNTQKSLAQKVMENLPLDIEQPQS